MDDEERQNRGYDEATRRNDGEDQIPTGVTPAEADVELQGHGAQPAGVAEDTDDVLDDTHDIDELAARVGAAPEPPSPEDVNTRDNLADWSRDDS